VSAASASPTAASLPTSAPRPLRVVVADDERDTVHTLATLLEEEGYQVRSLCSGAEVGRTVREFRPDAVLIAISGRYKGGSDRILSELVGFDHHVAKPYDINALLRLLAPLNS
jgi:AmiR/NasT family two-component response regulator